MSNEWDDDEQTDGPADLRKALKAQQKANAEMADRLSKAEATARNAVVKDVLTSKKVDPRIAKFIPADVGDEAGVASWLDENADLFGVKSPDSPPAATPDARSDGLNGQLIPQEGYQTLRSMADLESGAVPVEMATDLLHKIQNTTSAEELTALLGTHSSVSTSRSI